MSSVNTRYFSEGPVTQDKIEWLEKQIDCLQQANRELIHKINRDTVNLNINQSQITDLKALLRRNEG